VSTNASTESCFRDRLPGVLPEGGAEEEAVGEDENEPDDDDGDGEGDGSRLGRLAADVDVPLLLSSFRGECTGSGACVDPARSAPPRSCLIRSRCCWHIFSSSVILRLSTASRSLCALLAASLLFEVAGSSPLAL